MSNCTFCHQEIQDFDWNNGYCGVCGNELPDLDANLIHIIIPNEDEFSARVSSKVIKRLAQSLGVVLNEDESSGVLSTSIEDEETREEFLRNVGQCTLLSKYFDLSD